MDKEVVHCLVCHGRYKSHEVNSPECYEQRIKNKDRYIDHLQKVPTVCPTCRRKVKAKHLKDTVQGSGCIHCVDPQYVDTNDPEIIAEFEKDGKQYDEAAAILWEEEYI